jgi:hypothetical protein
MTGAGAALVVSAFGAALAGLLAAAVAGLAVGFLAGGFAGALAATLAATLAGALVGLLAAGRADFARDVRPLVPVDFGPALFAVVFDTLTGDAFADFLRVFSRVFLDIRLPFVAFGGSVFRAQQVLPGSTGQRGSALCYSADLGVWLEGIRRNPSRFAVMRQEPARRPNQDVSRRSRSGDRTLSV